MCCNLILEVLVQMLNLFGVYVIDAVESITLELKFLDNGGLMTNV